MQNKKILLINPSGHGLGALHLGYVAALLDIEKIDYQVLDAYQADLLEEFQRLMAREKFDILLLISSLMNPCLNVLGENISPDIANIGKRINPECVIIKDGIAATMYTEEVLTSKTADIAVIGESDITCIEVIKCLLNGGDLADVAGIAFLDKGKLNKLKSRELIADIDQLPQPARQRLNKARFSEKWHYVIVSRGCPFPCTICQPVSNKLFGKRVRYRNPRRVVDEIESIIRDYNVSKLQLWGDTFTVNRRWVLEFCDEILSRGISLNWLVGTRADCIDLELAAKMKQAGCIEIGYGIEAADEGLRNKLIKKCLKSEDIYKAVSINKKLGLSTRLAFLVGLPTGSVRQTLANLWGNIKIIIKSRPEWILVSNTSPIPGTELYEDSLSQGLLTSGHKWRLMVGDYSSSSFNNVSVARIRLEYVSLVLCWLLSNPFNLLRVIKSRLARLGKRQ